MPVHGTCGAGPAVRLTGPSNGGQACQATGRFDEHLSGGKMNQQMIDKVRDLATRTSQIVADTLAQKPCPLYAALHVVDDGRSVRLAGNSEGLVYLASLLLQLAVRQQANNHIHLGEGEVLDTADKNLILAFQEPN